MPTALVDDCRIQLLNDKDVTEGDFVLYWMQHSQRAERNDALEFAVQRANKNQVRLLVAFALTDTYPDANLRHYRFMLEGLQEVESRLTQRKIKFVLRLGDPVETIVKIARKAREVVCDRGYLRHLNKWRDAVARSCHCRVWQVEADVIVPVEQASDKQEYAARTLRSRINDAAEPYLHDLATTAVDKNSLNLSVDGEDLMGLDRLLERLDVDRNVKPCDEFRGGTSEAKARLKSFLSGGLGHYEDRPSLDESNVSMLSPYLHFGQVSPVQIALAVSSKRGHAVQSKEAFLEELLVRRELAINFVHYCSDYDSLACLPKWAAKTLDQHESDERPYHYTAAELEAAKTHDAAWNAMMIEMKRRGYLHNHLRMYWGKKIIEWTNTVDFAYRTALALNNRYFLDGRDCNSYGNIAWLFGMHDRAHAERDVFGKVRYMSANGLRRKIDVKKYIATVDERFGDLPSDSF